MSHNTWIEIVKETPISPCQRLKLSMNSFQKINDWRENVATSNKKLDIQKQQSSYHDATILPLWFVTMKKPFKFIEFFMIKFFIKSYSILEMWIP